MKAHYTGNNCDVMLFPVPHPLTPPPPSLHIPIFTYIALVQPGNVSVTNSLPQSCARHLGAMLYVASSMGASRTCHAKPK